MNHAQLRAFHAVAAEGGFSRAARRLGLTQPAITHQVRALEEAHGVTLFLRRGRRVVMTEAATELYSLAQRIFALHDEARSLLDEEGALKRGRLRVGADGPYHMMPILARLRAEHAELAISVTLGNSEEVQSSLLDYRTDVAVLAQFEDDPRFTAVRFGRHPVVVFVAKSHRLASRRSIRLAELDGQPMIAREPGSATRRAFDRALQAEGVNPNVVMEIGSREAVREAVAAGMGLGVVSAPEVGSDERIRLLAIEDADIYTDEFIVCLAERQDARSIRAFFRAARSLKARKLAH